MFLEFRVLPVNKFKDNPKGYDNQKKDEEQKDRVIDDLPSL